MREAVINNLNEQHLSIDSRELSIVVATFNQMLVKIQELAMDMQAAAKHGNSKENAVYEYCAEKLLTIIAELEPK